MAIRLLFSFDISGARAAVIPPAVLAAMGPRPKHQVLSNVWLMECANEADAQDFSDAMTAIQAKDHDFVAIVLAWVDGSPDVYVGARAAA